MSLKKPTAMSCGLFSCVIEMARSIIRCSMFCVRCSSIHHSVLYNSIHRSCFMAPLTPEILVLLDNRIQIVGV